MAPKKPKKPQPNQPDEPKQTLLSILTKKVESPLAEPPKHEELVKVGEQVLASEQVKEEKLVTPKLKPVKRILTPPTPTESLLQSPTSTETVPSVDSSSEPQPETHSNNAIFQAVGIIPGIVKFDNVGKATVALDDKEYPLYYSPNHRKAFDALRLQAKKNPLKVERLIVYPRVMHFPKREQHYQMSFQLLGFESPHTTEGITKDLEDFEFRLCGLWQFIPVCQIPVTVHGVGKGYRRK